MHIHKIPNRASPPTILLRESIREGRSVRKNTLANITHWPPERVRALDMALKGQFDHLTDAQQPRAGQSFGVLFALHNLAQDVGVVRALGRGRLGKLALFLALARVAKCGSRLGAVRWAETQAVAETLGLAPFTEDHLYRALDYAADSQTRIERALYHKHLDRRGAPPHLVLYDITSVWLEGEQNELSAYGLDRDHRRGKKIILIGLLTDDAGEPLAIRVFQGNRSDPSTVAEQVGVLRRQFGIEHLVFVGDRGMVRGKAKDAIAASDFQYISALTDPQIRRLLRERVLQQDLFDESVQEVELEGGVRLVLRRNPATQRKEEHRRQDKLTRLAELVSQRNAFVAQSPRAKPDSGLRTIDHWVARHKLTRQVQIELHDRQLQLTVDTQAVAEIAALDGCYVVESNVPRTVLNSQQLHDTYVSLQAVERDFRLLKTVGVDVRPVFVRSEKRTRGHAVIAFLALKILKEFNRRLAVHYGTTDQNPHAVTVDEALTSLQALPLLHYDLPNGREFTTLPTPNAYQAELLGALHQHLPRMAKQREGNEGPAPP